MPKYNSKKTLSVYPDIKELQYADNIDSVDLNKMFRSIEESSLRALIRSRELTSERDRIQLGVLKSFQSLNTRYASLSYMNDPGYAIASSYSRPAVDANVLYDTAYGNVTLPIVGSYSKIPRGEKYDGKVSPQVQVYFGPYGGSLVEQEYDSEIFDALDGTNTSFWIQEVTPLTAYTIRIDLPPTLTKRFNYIEIHPFPIYGFNITGVRYVDNFSVVRDVTKEIYGLNPLQNNKGETIKLYLSPKDSNGTILIDVLSSELGVVGFSNIDVKFLDFENTSQIGYMVFDSLDGSQVELTDILVDYYFDNARAQTLVTQNNPPIRAWLKTGYFNPNSSNRIKIESNPILGIDKEINLADPDETVDINAVITLNKTSTVPEYLWFVFELKEINTTTPVVKGCRVKYDRVESV